MGKKWILIGFAVLLIFSAFVAAFEISPFGTSRQSEAWMFKGAYATYEGQIDPPTSPCTVNEIIQVTGFNNTHVGVRTNSTIATSFLPPLTDQTILWVNKSDINFQPRGLTPGRIYSTQIPLRGMGVRDCLAYDYVNSLINATFFLDKSVLWPIRVVYVVAFENQTYSIEFNLKDTNIAVLK